MQSATREVPAGVLTLREAGAVAHRSPETLRRLCQRGVLPGHKIRLTDRPDYHGPGDPLAWGIAPDDLDAYLARAAGREAPCGVRRAATPPPTGRDKRAGYPTLGATCRVLQLTRAQLEGPGKAAPLAEARTVAAYLLYTDAHLSSPAIGRLLRRHHATVLYHLQKMTTRPHSHEAAWAIAEIRAQRDGRTPRTAAAP